MLCQVFSNLTPLTLQPSNSNGLEFLKFSKIMLRALFLVLFVCFIRIILIIARVVIIRASFVVVTNQGRSDDVYANTLQVFDGLIEIMGLGLAKAGD